MDLSTLDTLLKSHVSHLEKLYKQLGAPSNSVPTKLQELHNALVGTVQQQRQAAEDEVKQVQESIQALEATITRKRCQLSGKSANQESTTTQTPPSDLDSESLLQRRERLEKEEVSLERDVQLREKEIKHALEQLETYRPILGDFLDSDEHESLFSNVADLSLARLQALGTKLSQCKDEISRREQVFQSLLQEILDLWNELGISPSDATSPSADLTGQVGSADIDFDLAILPTARKLASIGHDMACSAHTTILQPDVKTIEALQNKKLSLEDERERRMQKIQELYDQLFPLWTRLGVSEEEADDFVEVWKGCEQRCIQAYEAELARMLQVKADNMAIFIHREREDIIALWDALYYSDAERAKFSVIEGEVYNEEILFAHEIEKQKLAEEKQSKEAILVKLARYFGLLDEMRQLEESANDPARLTGRGQRGDPGRLLREEKQRKRVAKEKPKLEVDLMTSIPMWEEQHGQPFMVNGSRLLEDLSAKVESEQAARPPSRRAKAPAPLPVGTTKQSAPHTISSKRTMQAHPSAPSVSSMNAASTAKRQRVGLPMASTSKSQAFSAGTRAVALGGVPATPCPPSSTSLPIARGNMMMVASDVRPSASSQTTSHKSGQSRLPTKSTLPLYTSSYPTAWHAIGMGVGKPALGNQSLFSPSGQPTGQQHHTKGAFRPRPSIASTVTAYSSGPGSSIFSGRSSRIASVATTASFGSDDAC